jgi:hypothetical protein
MIRYILILILSVLLGISSYLLYKNEYIVVNIETGGEGLKEGIVQGGNLYNRTTLESEGLKTAQRIKPEATLGPDIKDEIETLEEDSGTEIHLDPTVGLEINPEQHIASSYRVIGPREFVLLTDKEEPMVEIDLHTGQVKINPKYKLDEVSTEFWKSIGKKYPEVCFVE